MTAMCSAPLKTLKDQRIGSDKDVKAEVVYGSSSPSFLAKDPSASVSTSESTESIFKSLLLHKNNL
jgi:hypothetical protein